MNIKIIMIMMNMVTFLDFYFIFWIIGMLICCIIFLYLVYDTSFKKFDSLTDTWYFGLVKRHHKKLLKKDPKKYEEKFYYIYGNTDWYKELTNRKY
nr:MAG TPA: hypothetical protein [Ackermannviridae sp.]